MSVYDKILQGIKDEVTQDKKGLGYSGKTAAQIVIMLNNTYAKVVSSEVLMSPPINQILSGIENAPNAVDKTLLNAALAYVGT